MLKQFAKYITLDSLICLTGVLLFGSWLLRTSLGRKALADSVPRRTNMPFYLPFVPLFVWLVGVSLAVFIMRTLVGDLPGWREAFLENSVMGVGAVVTIAVILVLARASFARRLKGFGLHVKGIHRDFLAAPVLLASVWPLLLVAIVLTTFLGRLVWGQQYQLEQHAQLQLITAHPQWPLQILVAIIAVVIAPVLEETLFRGLFQTMVRSFLESSRFEVFAPAWQAIVISSLVFAMAHQNAGHWPALFVLGICLGYAYEKSGSLFRPIFVHALFNGITIMVALYQ